MQLRTLNKELAKINANLELEKGDGYFYFVFDCDCPGNQIWETHSIYVNNLNQLTLDQWIEEANQFVDKVLQAA